MECSSYIANKVQRHILLPSHSKIVASVLTTNDFKWLRSYLLLLWNHAGLYQEIRPISTLMSA